MKKILSLLVIVFFITANMAKHNRGQILNALINMTWSIKSQAKKTDIKKENKPLWLNDFQISETDKKIKTELSKIKFYYKKNKEPVRLFNDWYQKNENCTLISIINLGNINPTNYRVIRFLGTENQFNTKVSWGDKSYFGIKLKRFSDYPNLLISKISKRKIINPNDVPKYVSEDRFFALQNYVILQGFTSLAIARFFILTWYLENNN